MNTHKLKCQHPTQIQLIFDNHSKNINNQQQSEKNQQQTDKKQKDWPALGEVKGGKAAKGRLDDEAAEGRLEEEVTLWVFQLTISSNLSPLCQWDHKNNRNLMCSSRTISLCGLQGFSHRKPSAWQIEPHTRNPCHRAWLFSLSFASQASPHAVWQIYLCWPWHWAPRAVCSQRTLHHT